MRAGIMQPYFFPHLGYFALIDYVDIFILFDTPQFIRHGWIERNRILKLNGEPSYIKVPLEKHSRDTAIMDVKIRDDENWSKRIIDQIGHYKKYASNFHETKKFLKTNLKDQKATNIVDLNRSTLRATCDLLGIDTPIHVYSEMDMDIPDVDAADEWALEISLAIDADEYVNPPGGKSFFDRTKYDDRGLDLSFFEFNHPVYEQFGHEFVPNLSIIDPLMFIGLEQTKNALTDFKLT